MLFSFHVLKILEMSAAKHINAAERIKFNVRNIFIESTVKCIASYATKLN